MKVTSIFLIIFFLIERDVTIPAHIFSLPPKECLPTNLYFYSEKCNHILFFDYNDVEPFGTMIYYELLRHVNCLIWSTTRKNVKRILLKHRVSYGPSFKKHLRFQIRWFLNQEFTILPCRIVVRIPPNYSSYRFDEIKIISNMTNNNSHKTNDIKNETISTELQTILTNETTSLQYITNFANRQQTIEFSQPNDTDVPHKTTNLPKYITDSLPEDLELNTTNLQQNVTNSSLVFTDLEFNTSEFQTILPDSSMNWAETNLTLSTNFSNQENASQRMYTERNFILISNISTNKLHVDEFHKHLLQIKQKGVLDYRNKKNIRAKEILRNALTKTYNEIIEGEGGMLNVQINKEKIDEDRKIIDYEYLFETEVTNIKNLMKIGTDGMQELLFPSELVEEKMTTELMKEIDVVSHTLSTPEIQFAKKLPSNIPKKYTFIGFVALFLLVMIGTLILYHIIREQREVQKKNNEKLKRACSLSQTSIKYVRSI
ncbi:hypothetical protein SNEBB_004050 [Seison nebaliae]|nr:hypothetical protein SNEBB_004050 [Seison nebaliae]